MARPKKASPTLDYRSGWGWRVRVNGTQFRLGKASDDEATARKNYAAFMIRYSANPNIGRKTVLGMTMIELVEQFLRSDESPRGKQHRQKYKQLGPMFLQAFCRSIAAADYDAETHREFKAFLIGRGSYCRWTINDFLARVRRLLKFGRSRKICPSDNVAEVCDVPGVRQGDARDSNARTPANLNDVSLTLPFLPLELVPLVQVQLLCGARAGELLTMRPVEIERSSTPWLYIPKQHKGQWRGKSREIWLGPKAREILEARIEQIDEHEFMFSPQRSRPGKKGKLAPHPHYSRHSYSHAIQDACGRAGVAPWTSHQLRHRCGTEVRVAMGEEYAQAILGHTPAGVTGRYTREAYVRLAKEAAEKMG